MLIAVAVDYLAKKRCEHIVGSYGLFKLFYFTVPVIRPEFAGG
jgi:hypothetical protein